MSHLMRPLILLAVCFTLSGAGWQINPRWPVSCDESGQHSLRRQWLAFSAKIITCLRDPNLGTTARRSALSMLEDAYQQTSGTLPANNALPLGVANLILGQRFNDNQQIRFYAIEIEGELFNGEKIEHLELKTQRGQSILQLGDERAEWTQEENNFYLKVYESNPLPMGLYTLRIKLAGKNETEYLVPITDWASTRTPTILTPKSGESIQRENASVAWTAFTSTDKEVAYSARNFDLTISSNYGPDIATKTILHLRGKHGDRTSSRMKQDPSSPDLERGRYLLMLTYYEERRFGVIKIMKGSNTRHPFYVR